MCPAKVVQKSNLSLGHWKVGEIAHLLPFYSHDKECLYEITKRAEVGSIWNTCISNTYLIYFLYLVLQIEYLVFWYFKYFLSVDLFKYSIQNTFSKYFQHATLSNHVEACVYLPSAVVLVQWAEYCLYNVVM